MHDLDAAAAGRPVPPAARKPDLDQVCNYCDAPIMWCTSANGKRMPVDLEPSPDGNVLVQGQHAGALGKAQARAARAFGEQLRLHHVVSCPHAAQWNAQARAQAAQRRAGRR